MIGHYNKGWEAATARNHREAAMEFANVVNTMRDPKWPGYVARINSYTDRYKKDFDGLAGEFNDLCFQAGMYYHLCSMDYEDQGNLTSAFSYLYAAIKLTSYSSDSDHQNLAETYIRELASYYKKRGDSHKSNGNNEAANADYQRFVNLASSESLEDYKKDGFDADKFTPNGNILCNHGVEEYDIKNFAVAFHLWKKGADAGNEICQNNLGSLYQSGEGVSRNIREAKRLFKLSAAQGYELAKKNLKDLLGKRSGFMSFIFGIAAAVGIFNTAALVFQKLNIDNKTIFNSGLIAAAAAGFIVTLIAWRNRKYILFLIMLAVSVPGYLGVFGIIPKNVSALTDITAAETTATVTADSLNMRSEPSTSGDIIKTISKDDTVTLTGETQNGWSKVTHSGDTGWVSSEYLITDH